MTAFAARGESMAERKKKERERKKRDDGVGLCRIVATP
jgi:hypothetical protein